MLEKLLVFVEEPSMEIALELLLPKLLGDVLFEIRRFQCKDDLLKRLPMELKAIGSWLPDSWALLVLVDRDNDDCKVLKAQLEKMAKAAGLRTMTAASPGQRFHVANRIVVEELEAWFFGDWPAVQAAYPRVPPGLPKKAGFRDPDAIAGGTWEAMARVLKAAGYHQTGLRKLELARAVSAEMNPAMNSSKSFNSFRAAVDALVSSR